MEEALCRESLTLSSCPDRLLGLRTFVGVLIGQLSTQGRLLIGYAVVYIHALIVNL